MSMRLIKVLVFFVVVFMVMLFSGDGSRKVSLSAVVKAFAKEEL